MAAFQLDHNVPARLRWLLHAAGHDVISAREQGLDRAPDADLLLAAAAAGRLLVTHNLRDFVMLHRAWRRWPIAWGVAPAPEHSGILVIPQPPHVQPDDLAWAIEALLAGGTPIVNGLWRWVPSTGWAAPW